jgi:hypothetical protein
MTRWASGDLAGRVLTEMPKAGYKVKHINMKALQDDGTMLCDDVLSLAEYKQKTSVMSPEIAAANYQQEPIDLKGALYQKFNTTRNNLNLAVFMLIVILLMKVVIILYQSFMGCTSKSLIS